MKKDGPGLTSTARRLLDSLTPREKEILESRLTLDQEEKDAEPLSPRDFFHGGGTYERDPEPDRVGAKRLGPKDKPRRLKDAIPASQQALADAARQMPWSSATRDDDDHGDPAGSGGAGSGPTGG